MFYISKVNANLLTGFQSVKQLYFLWCKCVQHRVRDQRYPSILTITTFQYHILQLWYPNWIPRNSQLSFNIIHDIIENITNQRTNIHTYSLKTLKRKQALSAKNTDSCSETRDFKVDFKVLPLLASNFRFHSSAV